ncbi:unnamed protein product [Mucor circinelloides]|uniref:Alternative oxidase n=1 Tax=Mucor circinelloides f. circinelloides (strain 1006PhL) TaxID=1220926 RepID=S2JKA7_MUCC1|nr:hypothetical protein HMPREF1544_10298 [Mucor circinelloides 1006PhL]KAG1108354.1 hypothetical protein G6F42_016019 [Rhizopus arrhizus]
MLRSVTTHQFLKTAASPLVMSRTVLPAATISIARRSINTSMVQRQASAKDKMSDVINSMPKDVFREVIESRPIPMREEFIDGQKLTTESLENIDFGKGKHFKPRTMGDKAALYLVKALRTLPDTYFGSNHYMRSVMLETVAAVPGMVGAMLRHMKSLRSLKADNGWISHLLHEAENERFHLFLWLECLKPSAFQRLMILGVQGVFFNAYFTLYLFSPKTAHRMCGYLEEEAVISYTHFLNDIDSGKLPNGPAPQVAIDYYNLHPNATVRDTVLAVRADEAVHRDANHFLSDRIALKKEDLLSEVKEERDKHMAHRGTGSSSFA